MYVLYPGFSRVIQQLLEQKEGYLGLHTLRKHVKLFHWESLSPTGFGIIEGSVLGMYLPPAQVVYLPNKNSPGK